MTLRAIKHFLRSPKIIVGEITAIALAGVIGVICPRLAVFQSVWFLTLTLGFSVSLFIVIVEQIQRLRRTWSQPLTPDHFKAAPFRVEFERPLRTLENRDDPRVNIWSEQKLGLAGSAILHVGLLLVILAGVLRALFSAEASVDLIEGETLPPTAAAWAAQWPGLLASPIQLDRPVTLLAVKASRYESGGLRDLAIQSSAGNIAVNHGLQIGGARLYLGSDFGSAALIEWSFAQRDAALLSNAGNGNFEGTATGPDGLRVHLRTKIAADGSHPSVVEARVMKKNGLLFAGEVRSGETLSLSDGHSLTLRGTPFWARLRASRDSALWLAYVGFALVMSGATLIFTVVKADFCIMITPLGERERVFIALKPQRFAPLFRERFEQLVVEQMACSIPSESDHSFVSRESQSRLTSATTATVLLLCLFAFTACRPSNDQARQLVERYNKIVSEAYRRGDVNLIDPVVGPNEGKKLTGLIGVRLDLGLTLDAQLLSLEVTEVSSSKGELRVRTKEQWHYRDLRIGSGEQVGEESRDSYEMLYVFKKLKRDWVVDEIQFTSTPQVGRKTTTWVADRKTLHGVAAAFPAGKERVP